MSPLGKLSKSIWKREEPLEVYELAILSSLWYASPQFINALNGTPTSELCANIGRASELLRWLAHARKMSLPNVRHVNGQRRYRIPIGGPCQKWNELVTLLSSSGSLPSPVWQASPNSGVSRDQIGVPKRKRSNSPGSCNKQDWKAFQPIRLPNHYSMKWLFNDNLKNIITSPLK